MGVQYFIVAVIVICFIIWQWWSYINFNKRIKQIGESFPSDDEGNFVHQSDEGITTIGREGAKGDFSHTLEDINKYLSKNSNKIFDYQIIKEIVERNVRALEDEVDTIMSTPLYIGLMATILGIIFGVVVFAWKDLANLISGTHIDPSGIKVLLSDVGIAMIASFSGVLCTKLLTDRFNDAKTRMEHNKNLFLTWIQSDLMSKVDDDFTGAILTMTENLNKFNETFAENTKELKGTLSEVNDNYKQQVQLLNAINNLNITKIARANVDVYEKLKGCTDELEHLFEILANSENYVAKVIELNNKLGSVDERTKMFEALGEYFMKEEEHIRDRQGEMQRGIAEFDSTIQQALKNLLVSLDTGLTDISKISTTQNQQIQGVIDSQTQVLISSLNQQQDAVTNAINQIQNPFAGIKDIFKEGLGDINESFKVQNEAINEMLRNQTKLLTESLNAQKKAVSDKLESLPSELQSLTDIAKTLGEISKKMDSKARRPMAKVAKGSDNNPRPKSNFWDRIARMFQGND